MIYYDITDVMEYAPHNFTLSGIQRFSVQIVNHIVNKHGADKLRLIAFHPGKRRIQTYDSSYFSGRYTYDQVHFCAYFGLSDLRPATDLSVYLHKKYSSPLKRNIHLLRLLIANQLSGGETFKRRAIQRRIKVVPATPNDKLPNLKRGDIVFIGGATWNFDAYLGSLAQIRHGRGIQIYHYIHDLIPLIAPEHVVDDVPAQFERWLDHLSKNSDRFLTNSLATKHDLDEWLADHGISVPTQVVPLAHQFGNRPRVTPGVSWFDGKLRAHVLNAARLPYALCVGTLESRKNIWTLAQVWRQVYMKLGYKTPRLLFAGKHGWLKEDFDEFMRGTGSLNGIIRIIERPTDDELAFLYRNCLFSLFPSYKEGWGLPVGESMWLGRPVIASNISSMPEVGSALVDYADPYSPQSIEEAVLRMITDAHYRERRTAEILASPLRAWSDVADDLWRELTESSEQEAQVA